MLNFVYAECHIQAFFAECHYVECCYAECCYAECHYAECHLCRVAHTSFFAERRYAECHMQAFLLSVIKLSVVMFKVMAPTVEVVI